MTPLPDQPQRVRSFREFVIPALREAHARRPVSFYLMFAILIVVLLGAQVIYVKDDPRRFAFFLSLNFLFFFVVLFRAIIDFFDIIRGHFRENEAVFRDTLGEDGFVNELGRRVREEKEE